MFYIHGYKNSDKGININNAELVDANDQYVLNFEHATEKGWKSKKPIFVDFPYTVDADNFLEISDAVANELIAKYRNVKVKIYVDQYYSSNDATRNLALASFMHDPYDRG